jgi:hypothetical protein
MKLSSFLGRGQKNGPEESAGAALLARQRRVERSRPPARMAPSAGARRPEPPPLGCDDDRIAMSLEATYLMIGDRYDPAWLSPNELCDMTELMLAGRAIGRGEQTMLLRGPGGRGYPAADAGRRRDLIADWQDQLARAVGRSDLAAISRATRALGILGRVAVTRMPR